MYMSNLLFSLIPEIADAVASKETIGILITDIHSESVSC